MRFRWPGLELITILFIGSMSPSTMLIAVANEDPESFESDAEHESSLRVLITDIDASLVVGHEDQGTVMRLMLAVKAENCSDDTITVAREQFQLLIDGEPAEIGSVDSHQVFQRAALDPGKSAQGWLGFSSIKYDGKEPSMTLRWKTSANSLPQVEPTDVDLNHEFRRQSNLEQTRLGPGGCLLQIATNRDLDVLAIWPVADFLKTAAADKIDRIVFSSCRKQPPVLHEEFNLWLSGMVDSSGSQNDLAFRVAPRINAPFPRLEIQFQQISVGGLKEAVNRRLGMYRHSVAVVSSGETAIANALLPLYRHAALELAVADLEHPNHGVRRAAMAGSIDRLAPDKASLVIDEVLRGTPELQAEIAGYLNLVPGEKPVKALQILGSSDDATVSNPAILALFQSLNPAADAAINELWQQSRSKPKLKKQILSAIIYLNAERWTTLVAEYVSETIEAAATRTTDTENQNNVAGNTDESQSDDSVDSIGANNADLSSPNDLTSQSLLFLRRQHHEGTLETLRSCLLQLSDTELQDCALKELVEAGNTQDNDTIRECLDRRIRSEQISDDVRSAVIQLPSPEWTDFLLKDLKSNPGANPGALLRCASATQLDRIIEAFDSLPENAQPQILQHLAAVEHPGWKTLAKKVLEIPLPKSSDRNSAQRIHLRSIEKETVKLLGDDASEESIEMLTARLHRAMEEIGPMDEPPLESRLYVHRLIEIISMFSHPECRRSLNLAARCDNPDLREKAAKQIRDAMERSPGFAILRERWQEAARKGERIEDNEESLAIYDDCIDADPWLTEIHIRRSSVLMHLNRFEESLDALRTAGRLSPENMDIESMIALCKIRLGDTEAGLTYAEELVVMAPRDLSSLYNGACSYSRAIENENSSDEQKQRYGDRAIELIRRAIATNFDDFEHLQNDEDLVALHMHPEWSAVVEETRKLHEERTKNPQ